MKKIALILFVLSFHFAQSQVICIYCYQQNDSISYNVNNFIINGGFENTTCMTINDRYCPNSAGYNCDIANWTCTGGASNTYACIIDTNFYSTLVEGTHLAYFGNSFCGACSTSQTDTMCLVDSGCAVTGIPPGYPYNAGSAGSVGISLEQTVSGLIPGNTYVLEFWTGGEWPQSYPNRGMFAVDVGFGKIFLRNLPYHYPSQSIRFIIEFNAVSTTHTIRFTNWGHICPNCTELMLDDVKLYTLAELNPSVPSCSSVVQALFTSAGNLCPGTCTSFNNLSTNATSYLWSFPGANTSSSTDVNPQNICYPNPGNYDVQLIATGANGTDTLLLSNYITVYPTPPPQSITQTGDSLVANAGAVSYQWYYNGNSIPGATNYIYVATASGDYNVVAVDANGCEVEAVIYDVLAGLGTEINTQPFLILPNPVGDELKIQSRWLSGLRNGTAGEISVCNAIGEKLLTIPLRNTIGVSSLTPGIYFIEVRSQGNSLRARFIKE